MFLKRFTYADSFKEPIILFSLNKLHVVLVYKRRAIFDRHNYIGIYEYKHRTYLTMLSIFQAD